MIPRWARLALAVLILCSGFSADTRGVPNGTGAVAMACLPSG
jgi:hypothetical protein